ncbi:ABC transporter permease [Candidatus Woesearchaeota archaeon]|nr:ABC transporter permease [Candidatus Woesearchaeota archaeon]
MIQDYFKLAIKNLFHRRLRSWLTMLGIFIGIAAVVALISLGQGLQTAINEQFQVLGSDRLLIYPAGMAGPPGSDTSSARLYQDDVDVVKKSKGVKVAAGVLVQTLKVSKDKDFIYAMVFGIPTDKEGKEVFDITGRFDVQEGRKIKEGDRFNAVVGAEYVKENGPFGKPLEVGKIISLGGYDFKIVGIREALGAASYDTQIIITDEAIRDITGKKEEVSAIHAIVNEGEDPVEVAENIKKDLRKSRDVEKGKEDFEVQTAQQLITTVNTVLLIVQGIVIGIAAISLLVGAIGIMNTMYTAVLERTREIGVMKAVGAKNSGIFTLFFIEAGLLGSVGGIIGVLIGAGISKSVEFIGMAVWGTALIKATLPAWLIAGAIIFAFIIGAASGTFPAVQASKLQPVESLRYE